jgi:hypothetical protein
MRLSLVLFVAALAGSCSAPQPVPVAPRQVAELAGRTAGKAQRCVPAQPNPVFRVSQSDPHMLLYGEGKTIWATDLGPGCSFGESGTAQPENASSYYCHGDFVRAPGPLNLLPGPHCVLGDFLPYGR